MILDFRSSNFRSIGPEVDLSLLATTDKTFSESLIPFQKRNYLRTALIYGANGSGKSSVIDTMSIMVGHVVNSNVRQPGDKLYSIPHILYKDKPATFYMNFEKNDIEYCYSFTCDGNIFSDEVLTYKPAGRVTKIFSRIGEKIQFGSVFTSADKANCKSVLKENRLLLSVAANFTNIKPIVDAFLFFKEDLLFFNTALSEEKSFELENFEEYISDNESNKNRVIQICKEFGSDIENINIEEVKKDNKTIKAIKQAFKMAITSLPDIPKEFIESVGHDADEEETETKTFKIALKYPQFILPLGNESTGTKKFLCYVPSLISALDKGKTIICDELESNFHPAIVRRIIELFQNNKNSNAQIIFTTHNTSFLDSSLIRRDQIYFTELRKESDRSTDLYSLAEIKNVRNTENLEAGYLAGRYGAIPLFGASKDIIYDEDEDDY